VIGSYLLLISFFISFILNNYKFCFIIIVISALNDMFKLNIGFSIPIHYLIPFFYLPQIFKYFLNTYKPLNTYFGPLFFEYLYLIILTIIFGFIFPWSSYFDSNRSWTQLAYGRSLIQMFKYFSEFILLLFVLFLFKSNKIDHNFVKKVFSKIIIIMVLFTIIDILFDFHIKEFLFSNEPIVSNRFTALNGEPRNFGRNCSLALLILIFYNSSNSKKYFIPILFSIIGIIISLSASTYLATLLWIFLFLLTLKSVRLLIFPSIAILIFIFNNFSNTENAFISETTTKIKIVSGILNNNLETEDKVYNDEPNLFSSFEVFDRAALNFLYLNKLYILTGTGPNLISIPSSPYLNSKAFAIYGDSIDSVPHMFLINLLARSGIIGLFFWILFIISYNFKKSRNSNIFFNLTIVFHFIVFNPVFFLYIAIITSKKLNYY
jgi:hypothetical protein